MSLALSALDCYSRCSGDLEREMGSKGGGEREDRSMRVRIVCMEDLKHEV